MKSLIAKLSFLVLLTGIYAFGDVAPVEAAGPTCSGGGSTCTCCATCTCVSNSSGCACVDHFPGLE